MCIIWVKKLMQRHGVLRLHNRVFVLHFTLRINRFIWNLGTFIRRVFYYR